MLEVAFVFFVVWSVLAYGEGASQVIRDSPSCEYKTTAPALPGAPEDRFARANPLYGAVYWFQSAPGCAASIKSRRR
jgi:hypothetical protein